MRLRPTTRGRKKNDVQSLRHVRPSMPGLRAFPVPPVPQVDPNLCTPCSCCQGGLPRKGDRPFMNFVPSTHPCPQPFRRRPAPDLGDHRSSFLASPSLWLEDSLRAQATARCRHTIGPYPLERPRQNRPSDKIVKSWTHNNNLVNMAQHKYNNVIL
jgi:hypothetical protein